MIGTRLAAPALFAAPAPIAPPIADAPDPAVAAPVAPAVAPAGIMSQAGAEIAGRQQSLWDRLNAATGGSGAWLRAAGALFNGGGIGGAINAAAGYGDQQKAIAAASGQQQFENTLSAMRQALADRTEADSHGVALGNLGVSQANTIESGRHNRADEFLQAGQQGIQRYGIDTTAATTRRGQDVQLATNAVDNATSRANNAATNAASTANNVRSTDASRYATDNADEKPVATIKVPSAPATTHWFTPNTPAVPGGTQQVYALPASPSPATLTPGKVYATARGNARWNGTGFDPL